MNELLSTVDAQVWAEEFCRDRVIMIATGGGLYEEVEDPVGLMISWFANAMETAKQHQLSNLTVEAFLQELRTREILAELKANNG